MGGGSAPVGLTRKSVGSGTRNPGFESQLPNSQLKGLWAVTHLSGPQFLHLLNGNNDPSYLRGRGEAQILCGNTWPASA